MTEEPGMSRDRSPDLGEPMQNPIRWSWTINIPMIVGGLGLLVGGVTWINNIQNAQRETERFRVERTASTDRNFVDIRNELRNLNNIPYRVTVVEQKIESTNARIDRLTESLLTSIEGLRKDVGGLSTKVEVLSQKIEMITPAGPRKSALRAASTVTE